jgi:hypothetical protein
MFAMATECPSVACRVTVAVAVSTFTLRRVISVLAATSSSWANGRTNSGVGVTAAAPSRSVKDVFPFRKKPVTPLVLLDTSTQPLKGAELPKISVKSRAYWEPGDRLTVTGLVMPIPDNRLPSGRYAVNVMEAVSGVGLLMARPVYSWGDEITRGKSSRLCAFDSRANTRRMNRKAAFLQQPLDTDLHTAEATLGFLALVLLSGFS